MRGQETPQMVEKEIVGANILRLKVGTNGFMGGDAGHGSVTHFELRDAGNTEGQFEVLGDRRGVRIELAGDEELRTFVEALEFASDTLKSQSGAGRDRELPLQVGNEIDKLQGELRDLARDGWSFRQSKKGADQLKELANRIVLSAKRLESLVKANTFPNA